MGWVFLATLGVFQLALPYFFYTKAIRHVSAIEAILVPVIEPILNPVWVLFLLGERPGRMALVGGAIILFSVLGRAFAPTVRSALRKAA
jgi:drug/metabolite transporter (DMT)-like permease